MADDRPVPLCVDLDGSLIRTDLLWESAVQLWRRPALAVRALWILTSRGKAAFKAELAGTVAIDPARLPYRQSVLEFVRAEHAAGREIVLATASHRSAAQAIADHLRLFHRVLATEGDVNLSGARKQAALELAFGRGGFDYIGDHRKDLPVFAAAREALLVEPSAALRQRAAGTATVGRIFEEPSSTPAVLARALRLHQWAKNVLLAVPLLAAHLVLDADAWLRLLVAFAAFGAVASATYLLNDLLDLAADRAHEKKRHRPLASGLLSIPAALALAAALALLGAAATVLLLPPAFSAYLGIYVALTLAYSVYLKRRLLVDVLALAILYTLRILAGGAAIGVMVSEWLLMFSLFLFISLAFLKRSIEVRAQAGTQTVAGRGYSAVDADMIRTMGVSSGLLSVLVLALYISGETVTALYRAPALLWLICPLLVYWIARIWFLAGRGEVHHDPVVFALLDWRSYLTGALVLAVAAAAKTGAPGLHW